MRWYLRIPEVSKATDYHNVIENLRRMHDLPSIHICRQPLYPPEAIIKWVEEKTILKLTLNDVDFAKEKIIVQPKSNTPCTWRWLVKDKERREAPLVEKAAKLLITLQEKMPNGHPYFFLGPERYQHLMHLKATGGLIDRVAKCPDNNFRRNWNVIWGHTGVENATFHDLRATCITEWFEQGLMPQEIQRLAGHSSIETTMKFYVGFRRNDDRPGTAGKFGCTRWRFCCKSVAARLKV